MTGSYGVGIPGPQTFCSPDSNNCLDTDVSQASDTALQIAYLLDGEFRSSALFSARASCSTLSSLLGYGPCMMIVCAGWSCPVFIDLSAGPDRDPVPPFTF